MRTASDLGYVAVSANDHLVWQRSWLDGPTALAAVAGEAGSMALVTSITLPVVRHPVVVANTLSSLASLTQSRVMAGPGPGSSRADYDPVGVPFAERFARFDEAVPLVRHLVRGEATTVGRFYGAAGPLVAVADGWFASACNATPAEYAAARARLDRHLVAAGREPSTFPDAIATAWAMVTTSASERERVLHDLLGRLLGRDPETLGNLPVGSPARCAEAFAAYAEAGATLMFVWPLRDPRSQLAAQATVIAGALDALPDDLDAELRAKAEAQLVADAGHFAPRELRVLGRRVLEVVAPDLAERMEERLLRAEEERGRCEARLIFRPRGDGVTDLVARVPDQVADRLRVYLDAFTAPRQGALHPPTGDVEALPLPRRRCEAFCALLELMPADGLPAHGGTATSVMVVVDLETLRSGLGTASLSTGGLMTATEVRRTACTAGLLPVVLGGAGEVLDLGRTRRLFSPAQRKALAIRDRGCRAEECEIPAAWCEAHHAGTPWAAGGRSDLEDGLLLCSFHHHRAHDPRWRSQRMPSGDLRFNRRT